MNIKFEDELQLVASNIRKVREFRNYTQEYLAMKLGISQNAYSKIELAYTRITLVRLFEISEILETDPINIIINSEIDVKKMF